MGTSRQVEAREVKADKRTFVGIAGGVAAATVLVLATLWFSLWAPPTRQDFKRALGDVTELRSVYESLSLTSSEYTQKAVAALRTGGDTAAVGRATNAELKAYNAAATNHEAVIKRLEKSAVLRDTQANAAYDSFSQRDEAFGRYVQSVVDSYPLFYHTYITCGDIYSLESSTDTVKIAEQHKKAAEDCLADVDTLAKSKNEVLADYGKQYGEIVRARQAAFDEVAKSSSPSVRAKSAQVIKDLAARVTSLDPISKLQKARETARDNGSLNKFEDLLKQKSQG